MGKKLMLTLWILAWALFPGAKPGWAELDQNILQKLQGDWTNLDEAATGGAAIRYLIRFEVAEGLLRKGYLDPKTGEYRELNVTRIRFTDAANNLIKLASLDDEADSAQCVFQNGDQEVVCRDDQAIQVMRLKRHRE